MVSDLFCLCCGAGEDIETLTMESSILIVLLRNDVLTLHDAFVWEIRNAGLSAELGAGRNVLFHGGFAGKKAGFAGGGNRFASVVGEAGKTSLSLRHRGLGGVAGSSALRLDPAARRCGLCDPVAVDQAAFRQGFTEAGAAFGGEKTP